MKYFNNIYSIFKNYYLAYGKYHKTRQKQYGCLFNFYNFWDDQSADEMWLSRFLRYRGIINNSRKSLSFYSVYGPREVIEFDKSDVKIFYTGENLKNVAHRAVYADSFLGDRRINLSIGFEFFKDKRYLRIPLWLLNVFAPNATSNDIKRICKLLNKPSFNNRRKFASIIASWDPTGTRTNMKNDLSSIDDICCPGKWCHNDDTLKELFNDDKLEYLRDFKFNICPENSDVYGYVTEKLFQAIVAGCIPIYWGSDNKPELDVLNQNAILFWKQGDDNTSLIKQVRDLNSNDKLYKEFLSQPRFTNEAADIICNMFDDLEIKFKEIFK